MKKQAANRKYNFPDADLYLQCVERIRHANRDLEYFTKYGYDVERLRKFNNLVEKFRQLPDDDELVGDQMLMTEKKYAAAEKLKTAIRSLMTRVGMKFSNRTGRYRKFGTSKMGDMTDAQLIFCGRRVVRVARAQIDFLAETGLNEFVIGKVQDATQEFERAVNIQHDRVADRDIAVERRTDLGNQLYDEMIVVCDIGKDIWAETDKTKYDQYAVYESNADQKRKRREKLAAEANEKSGE